MIDLHNLAILTPESLAACTAALKKLFGKLADSAAGNIQRRLKTWATEERLKRLGRNLAEARMVKTLWTFDQRVDLFAFYYSQIAQTATGTKKLTSVDDLRNPKDQYGIRVAISGRVGMGKTMLSRYLSVVELMRGEKIPIFFELRQLNNGKSLFSHLKNALQLLDLSVDTQVTKHLLSSGSLIIFLDGFDEIAPDKRVKFLSDIQRLSTLYYKNDWIITSRPDTDAFTLTGFHRATLMELTESDLTPLILRLMGETRPAELLTRELLGSRRDLIPILTTPLIVTLLVISFKTSSEIPAILSDFYGRLMISLLNRHDKSKPGGFNRPRLAPYGDVDFIRLFDAFCILTAQKDQLEMRLAHAVDAAKNGAKACGLNASEVPAFLEDVLSITCLLLREGEIVRFCHRSIQEYHAAKFIADANDEDAVKFYTRVQSPDNLKRFLQVLEFLRDLDRLRFERFFLLPDRLAFLNAIESRVITENMKGSAQTLLHSIRLIVK